MHICVWSLTQGAWGRTHPRGKQSDCTGCPGNRRQWSLSAARWSVGSHSNLEDTRDITKHYKWATTLFSVLGFNGFVLGPHRPEAWGQRTPGHLPPPALVSDRSLHGPAARPVPREPCTALWWTELPAGPTLGSAPAASAGRCPLSASDPQGQ